MPGLQKKAGGRGRAQPPVRGELGLVGIPIHVIVLAEEEVIVEAEEGVVIRT